MILFVEVTRFAMMEKHYTQGMSIDSCVVKRCHADGHFLINCKVTFYSAVFPVKISQIMVSCWKLSPAYLTSKVGRISRSVKSARGQFVVALVCYR